jgi:hypothetical protein
MSDHNRQLVAQFTLAFPSSIRRLVWLLTSSSALWGHSVQKLDASRAWSWQARERRETP